LELAFDHARQRRSERLELIRLLGRTGSGRAARLLVPIAEHADDLELRLAALAALGELGPDAAAGALARGLDDPEASVRLAAALSIRKSAPRGAAEALLGRLEHAPAQDRAAVALALGGALAGSKDEQLSARVARLAFSSRDGERDSLIEALAHAPTRSAQVALLRFAKSPDPWDRSKAAEALGMRGDGIEALLELAADSKSEVRAAAVWGLGAVGSAREQGLLVRLLRDSDTAVAANAASSLGRIRARIPSSDARELCEALKDGRTGVRESALSALRVLGQRCLDHRERRLLSSDRASRVRLAAARLLRDVGSSAEDQKRLRRCASEEVTGAVAAECLRAPSAVPSGARELLVFIVPVAEAAPVGGAPFALVRPDGLVRHGTSDRRGAVAEAFVPDGLVELAVPTAIAE
jgi:HEAT repeat protein